LRNGTGIGTIVAPRKREKARKALLGFKGGRCNEGGATLGKCLN